jgi:carbamoyl-phosphate synthase large subunit
LDLDTYSVKVPVFPFSKFPGSDVLLGPEMRSTGEVMGRGKSFESAYAKGLTGAGMALPQKGNVFISVRDEDKKGVLGIARDLVGLGFVLYATKGTALYLESEGIRADSINKAHEGSPHCVEALKDGRFALVINTVSDEQAIKDSLSIRRATLEKKVPYVTLISAARMMVRGISERRTGGLEILPL